MANKNISIAPPASIDLVSIEPTIDRYFTSLNDRDFKATAALFAERGCLKPPFDRPIRGREQIANYLEKEAVEMIFTPASGELVATTELGDLYCSG